MTKLWILSLLLGIIQAKKQPMNILFLASDDLRPNLGVYQDLNSPIYSAPFMYTPNLDALASQSLLFERAYVQQSLCSPSRTSLMTGRRPDTTRITRIGTYWRELGGNFTTIPQFFKEQGYVTAGGGKLFHGGPSSDHNDPISWTHGYHTTPDVDDHKRTWKAFTEEELAEEPLRDTIEVDHMINTLRLYSKNVSEGQYPIFLGVGMQRPHLPWFFPERFLDYYPEEDIDLPLNPYAPVGMPEMAWHKPTVMLWDDCTPENVGVPDFGEINVTLPITKVKELRRAYYAAASHADDELGRMINKLIDLDMWDTTIIVFWGDHGWQLGEHSEWGKLTNFEIATRVPFMIRVPGVTDGGMRTSEKVELVDLFPTLVELAGFDPLPLCPENSHKTELCSEGTSLAPLFENTENKLKDAVFWQHPRGIVTDEIPEAMGYSIYTDEYHYTEWVAIKRLEEPHAYEPDWEAQLDTPELYLVTDDIQENINRFAEEEFADVIKDLSKRLHVGWRGELRSLQL